MTGYEKIPRAFCSLFECRFFIRGLALYQSLLHSAFLLTVPFVWDEHEPPFDFGRYSSFGIRHLLEKNGFTVLVQRKSVDDVRVIFQLLNAYLYKKTVTRSSLLNAALTLFLMAPFNIMGEILGRLLPKNADLYLDNIVLARKT